MPTEIFLDESAYRQNFHGYQQESQAAISEIHP